jgi:RND family efflux transporter MFP subunit
MEFDKPKRRPRKLWLWGGLGVVVIMIAVGAGVIVKNAQGNGGDKAHEADSTQVAENGEDGKDNENGENGNGENGNGEPAAPVELFTVNQGHISTFLQTTATLEARNMATLVAQKQGQVTALYVEEGDWVNKGAVLATLDDAEATVGLERAEVNLEVARRDAERATALLERDLISEKEKDDYHLALRTAEVELEQRKFEYSQTRLTAPFSGRVSERLINLGETVTIGRQCFSVVDFHPLRARLYFPERELARVEVGQEATLKVDTHPGHEFAARVALVNPVIDETNGTFKVTLEIPNSTGALRPGTFARVLVKTGEFANAVLMPKRGVLTEDGEDYVFVARSDTVDRVPVTVGAIEGDTAQILTGLAPGDSVVTIGQGGLKPGAKIKSVNF